MDYPFEEGALEIHRTSQFYLLDEINKLTQLGFSGQSDYSVIVFIAILYVSSYLEKFSNLR